MAAKDIMKLMLSILILAAGVKAVAFFAGSFISAPVPGVSPQLLKTIDNVSNIFALGMLVIALLLLPVYLSKRSHEKKVAVPAKK